MTDIRFDITVKGKKYPCLMTMGALIDFKRRTGHEAGEATDDTVLDLIYYCAKSVAVADGSPLPFSVDEFPYLLTVDEGATAIEAYSKAVMSTVEPKKATGQAAPKA